MNQKNMLTQGAIQLLATLPLRRPAAVGQVQLLFDDVKPTGIPQIRAMPFGVSRRRVMLLDV